eukprot:GEMP01007171.1.p1 GENE.GEMP01007171.1~~GEMP01007171.1.p1  ORF type:complete len:200 (+),score=40.72 GEMP01007171.1:101-700(+)
MSSDLRARVWVGGLPHGTSEEDMMQHAGKFGKVLWTRVRSSQRDTFCFVQYDLEDDAQKMIKTLDQTKVFDNGLITCSRAKQEAPRDRMRGRSSPREERGRRGYSRRRNSRSRSRLPVRKRIRSRSRRHKDHSPRRSSPRRPSSRGSGFRVRSPHEDRGRRPQANAGFKITIENIPKDMTWAELKDFGHKRNIISPSKS